MKNDFGDMSPSSELFAVDLLDCTSFRITQAREFTLPRMLGQLPVILVKELE